MEQFPEQTTVTVVETVSKALGTPHTELPPLSNAVNLDALNAAMTADSASDVTVMFTYSGLRVTVYSRETAYARPIASDGDVSEETTSHMGEEDIS